VGRTPCWLLQLIVRAAPDPARPLPIAPAGVLLRPARPPVTAERTAVVRRSVMIQISTIHKTAYIGLQELTGLAISGHRREGP